jgi:aryl-alcohol dehydrogenase-like predicted oxidoreductase
MEYTRLGTTGLKVSRLGLGCMSYGDPTTPNAHPWALTEDLAQPFFQQAVELGVTFWDTANVYQLGTSEEIVGRAIVRYSRREDIVLATKVRGWMHDGPGGEGLSRKAIFEQVDASLTRLGTDYIDLYQIHRFDAETPVDETMEALHDIVRVGKVRYIGASSMYAWEFAKLQHAADLGGWTRFVSMQNQYNLLRRYDERELMAMCGDMGVGLVPYSPNGKGRLARPAGEQSQRSSTDKVVQAFDSPYDEPVISAVQKLAEKRRVSMAQIALAWVLRNPLVSAPIVGATKPHHLPEAVDAVGLELTDEEVQGL